MNNVFGVRIWILLFIYLKVQLKKYNENVSVYFFVVPESFYWSKKLKWNFLMFRLVPKSFMKALKVFMKLFKLPQSSLKINLKVKFLL